MRHRDHTSAACRLLRLAAVALIAAGCDAAPSSDGSGSDPEAPSPQVQTETPPSAASAEALQVGEQAPDFEVETLGGERLRLSSYFGQGKPPTVLLFDRAHW